MEIKVTTKVVIEPKQDGKPKLKGVEINLCLPPGLDESGYYEGDHPNSLGVQAITSTLVQGLVANIHGAHQHGTRDSAEHLRYIISELERGFAARVTVS